MPGTSIKTGTRVNSAPRRDGAFHESRSDCWQPPWCQQFGHPPLCLLWLAPTLHHTKPHHTPQPLSPLPATSTPPPSPPSLAHTSDTLRADEKPNRRTKRSFPVLDNALNLKIKLATSVQKTIRWSVTNLQTEPAGISMYWQTNVGSAMRSHTCWTWQYLHRGWVLSAGNAVQCAVMGLPSALQTRQTCKPRSQHKRTLLEGKPGH